MKKSDGIEFEQWFSTLQVNVLDETGVNFQDEDSVKDDYEKDADVYDIIASIVAEYE